MTKLELEIHDDIMSVINKIKNINDSGIDLVIPEGSILFDNVVNLKLIEQKARDWEISIQFTTEDPIGNNLISMLNGKEDHEAFVDELLEQVEEKESKVTTSKRKVTLPKLNLKFKKSAYIIPIIGIFILGGALFAGSTLPKATAKITVKSQPLTRSITVKVITNSETSAEDKILKGTTLETSVENTEEIETTGEKIIGEKAKGKIRIYNKTDSEVELDKGDTVAFKEDDNDLYFYLDDDVNVPSRTSQDPTDPASPLIPGEAEVDVIASNIGSQYNIDDGKVMELEDFKKSEVEAKSIEDFTGGKSETVKVVSEDDKTTLSENLTTKNKDSATNDLNKKVGKTQSLIQGSVSVNITEETYSNEVNSETDKLSLNQKVSALGLVYLNEDLSKMMDKIVEDLIPKGYQLSEEDREINVEVLGNSTSSVLSTTEADIQVTLKTYVVPSIDKEQLKQQLSGLKPQDAQKILGSIQNVDSYDFKISPSIPLFKKVPKSIDRIFIEINTD